MCGKADPKLVKQIDEILAQNRKIIEMNERIVRAIMSPPPMVKMPNIDIDLLRRQSEWKIT